MAEYRQGTGPNRLPQGGAAQVNAATPPELDNMDIPVVFAPGEEDPLEDERGLDEDAQILLEPPDPRFAPQPKDREGRIPRYVVRHLPQLMAAARDPNAHPTLRAYYASIVRNLEREMQRGGR